MYLRGCEQIVFPMERQVNFSLHFIMSVETWSMLSLGTVFEGLLGLDTVIGIEAHECVQVPL